MPRYQTVVDAMIILVREGKVLLAQRQGTGYADGAWNLPSGHLEAGEPVHQGVIREAREEIGIGLEPDDVRFVHLCHYRNPEGQARIGVFFEARAWQGEPYNAEPHKCAQIAWFPLNDLPLETYPYTAAGVQEYASGSLYAAVGWTPA
ncbi:NUDIX domain-containing protein [Nonomuraea sp. NPDC059023]|uniref:NUDIX hydrolase n=1 Tax=unclassified Nonomuraea TaxID=2593643 RepID=UPI0036A79ADF